MFPYKELANSIIITAVNDYRNLLKRKKWLEREPRYNGVRIHSVVTDLKIIEDFFHSEWFTLLSDINPGDIIKKIRNEVEQ